jgi:transposase
MWRKQVRSGALVAEQAPVFMPVQIVPDPLVRSGSLSAALSQTSALGEADPGRQAPQIEIVLPDGTTLRVSETIDASALRRVLSVLRG